MKKITILAIFLISLLTLGNVYTQTVYKFNEGLSAAKSQKKLVVINICVDNDSWCKKMDAVYASDAVKNALNSFIYIKLDAAGSEKYSYDGKSISASDLAKLFGVTGYPTHVFLNPDGSVIKFKYNGDLIGSFSGFVESQDFEKILKYFSNGQYKDTDLSKVF